MRCEWKESPIETTKKVQKAYFVLDLLMAGDPRFELGLPVPETGVLPLDQSPTITN